MTLLTRILTIDVGIVPQPGRFHFKQYHNLEVIRVRSNIAIRNTIAFILAVAYFAAVYLGDNLKLKVLVERIYLVSKRLFEVPTFFNYAMADGLNNLLFTHKTGIQGLRKKAKQAEFQLAFSFWDECG